MSDEMSELKSSRRIISDQSTIFISRALKSPLTIMWLSNFKRICFISLCKYLGLCQPLRAKWTKKTFWEKKAILIEGVTVWCGIKDLYHDLPAANGRLMLHIGNTEQWRPYIFLYILLHFYSTHLKTWSLLHQHNAHLHSFIPASK